MPVRVIAYQWTNNGQLHQDVLFSLSLWQRSSELRPDSTSNSMPRCFRSITLSFLFLLLTLCWFLRHNPRYRVAWWYSGTVASQQAGLGWFGSRIGELSVWSLHVLLVSGWVPSRFSSHRPKTCKLGELVTLKCLQLCECECTCLFVSKCQPCDELPFCPGCTSPCTQRQLG